MILGFFSVFGRNLWNSDKIWCIFSKNRRENCKISVILLEIHENVTKICDENLLNCWGRRGAKEYKSCRSRQELSNEYLLAKIGFDTAENEPSKVWRGQMPCDARGRAARARGPAPRVIESVMCDRNFGGLVLGCIEADFCNNILVGKLVTRSIKFT